LVPWPTSRLFCRPPAAAAAPAPLAPPSDGALVAAARLAGAREGPLLVTLGEVHAQKTSAQACGAGRHRPTALRALLKAGPEGCSIKGIAERALALGLEAGWDPRRRCRA
jgi:hypothetical protein